MSDPTPDEKVVDRLFGLPAADELESDIDGVVAMLTEPGEYEVEEWTCRPPIGHLPTSLDLGEFVAESTTETTEEFDAQVWDAIYSDEVKAALDVALALIATRVTYRMADRCVATHRIRVTEDGDWEAVADRALEGETNE